MTESSEPKIAGLLLAAGGSSRLGRPKQLLEIEGKTLVRRAAEALIEAGCSPILVVLGSEFEGSRKQLEGLPVEVIENPDWPSGMSTSIVAGVGHLVEIEPSCAAVLITVCDQPFVTGSHLRRFVEEFYATRKSMIAAEYNGVTGVPAIFDRSRFDDLRDLRGDKGARELIRNSSAASIPLSEAGVDIDTAADAERFN